ACQLHRHHPAHGDEPAFGGAVGGAAQVAAQPRDRADVDDAPAALSHLPSGRLTHQEDTAQIDREDAVEELERGIEEWLVGADARAIHEHIDAPEPREHGIDQSVDAPGLADIELVTMNA